MLPASRVQRAHRPSPFVPRTARSVSTGLFSKVPNCGRSNPVFRIPFYTSSECSDWARQATVESNALELRISPHSVVRLVIFRRHVYRRWLAVLRWHQRTATTLWPVSDMCACRGAIAPAVAAKHGPQSMFHASWSLCSIVTPVDYCSAHYCCTASCFDAAL